MKAKITLQAEMPSEHLEEFIRYVQLWDRHHDDCHFSVLADSDEDRSVGDMMQMLERLGLEIIFAARK